MTQWVEEPSGGRERGPRAIVRAWFEVLVRPARFFRTGVGEGDQAPGLVFAVLVVLIAESSRVAILELADRGIVSTGPFEYSIYAGLPTVERALLVIVAVVFVAPAALHLVAALQTVILRPFAPDRGGVSETVQVIAYAMAPCVFAGLPIAEVRVVAVLWGVALYVYGTSVVHEVSIPRALALGAIPAAFVFGYAFRGVDAAQVLLGL